MGARSRRVDATGDHGRVAMYNDVVVLVFLARASVVQNKVEGRVGVGQLQQLSNVPLQLERGDVI